MNQLKRKLSMMLALVMIVTVLAPSLTVSAADYGKKLDLSAHTMKYGKTTTYTSEGSYQEDTLWPKAVKGKVVTKIKVSKRKSVGKNYQVTYNVTVDFKKNPKIKTKKIGYEDWYWSLAMPQPFNAVFDYKTGKESTKVKVTDLSSKETFYKKQHFVCPEIGEDYWIRNPKKLTYSFKVTYPKSYKNAVVAVGFSNDNGYCDASDEHYDWLKSFNALGAYNNRYWKGKEVFGKTSYYKNGKKSTAFMRLK